MKSLARILLTLILLPLAAACGAGTPTSPAETPTASPTAPIIPQATALPSPTQQPGYQKGFSIATWDSNTYGHKYTIQSLQNLRETGTEWLAVVVTWYQHDVDSLEISPTSRTPTDDSVRTLLAEAHELGFKVMLKPHIDLDGGGDGWRGVIGRNFNDEQWSQWFASYTAMMIHFGRLAQENGVEQFCIGTELGVAARQAEHWRAVAAAVREVYHGKLVYASNSPVMEEITWWDALDYIGVNAYLSDDFSREVSLAEIEAVWRAFIPRLKALSDRFNQMPVLITETGSASYDGAANHPAYFEHDQPLDQQEQADSYQAFFNATLGQTWLAGVYWWGWEANPYRGGRCDNGFTPYNKSAEAALRAGFGASAWQPEETTIPAPTDNIGSPVFTGEFSPGWDPSWSWDTDYALVPDPDGSSRSVAAVQSWGGYLSLHHLPFDTARFRWLSLRIRFSRPGQRLYLALSDENDRMLSGYLLSDCLSIHGADFSPETWQTFLIPLEHLLANGRPVQRINIGGDPADESLFWIADLRWLP